MSFSLFSLFTAGLATFFTPCVLPLIPVYLAAVAGVESPGDRPSGARLFLRAAAFSLGIVLVFALFGAAAATLGGLVKTYNHYLLLFGGVLVLLFGLKFIGFIHIPLFDRIVRIDEARFSSRIGLLNAFAMGLVFGAGWSPCVGPILGAALTFTAASGASIPVGMFYLTLYGIGFTTPFLLTALFADHLLPLLRRANKGLPLFEKLVGILLIAGSLYLFTEAVAQPPQIVPAVISAPQAKQERFPLPDGLPALVEFYSADCPVCKKMEPIVARIFERCDGNKVTLRKVDISKSENRNYVAAHRIIGVPTFILFDTQRNEVARLVGLQTEEAIYQAIATLRGEQCDGVGLLPTTPAAEGTACGAK
ncbi:MAG TPA: cytochrome c biogenesis protein CcdA [bacterium]|nr:cytochrome c biogenesis protein CcdA [bacterium]